MFFRNQGRSFPPHLDLRESNARAGTKIISAIDKELVVVFNRKRNIFELHGPSLAQGGWVHLLDIVDDYGTPFMPPDIPWLRIAKTIQSSRDSVETVFDRIEAHNRVLEAKRAAAAELERKAKVKYTQKSIAEQWVGNARHSAYDVMLGLRNAMFGRGKDPEPGRKTFNPGVQPATGGVQHQQPQLKIEEE